MRPLSECLRYEVETENGWVPVHCEQLDRGDIVRSYRPNGTLVDDPRVSSRMVLSSSVVVECITVADLKMQEVQAAWLDGDRSYALALCLNFINEHLSVEHHSVVNGFLDEVYTKVWLPIQAQAIPITLLIAVLHSTYEARAVLTGWHNLRDCTIDRIKDEKGDVQLAMRGLL
jgi:hypothetical protein